MRYSAPMEDKLLRPHVGHDTLPPFYLRQPVSYDCPRCLVGRLCLVEGTFVAHPTPTTRDAEEAGFLEPWEGQDRFTCLLECSSPTCQEILACAGSMVQEQDWSAGHPDARSRCHPTLLHPLNAARDSQPGETTWLRLSLDVTDETILRLLANEEARLTTRVIAERLHRDAKSIGKNLSKLRKSGLVENRPRHGYRITDRGRVHAPQR